MRYPKEWLGLECSCGIVWELLEVPEDSKYPGEGTILRLRWCEENAIGFDMLKRTKHQYRPLTPAAREFLKIRVGKQK